MTAEDRSWVNTNIKHATWSPSTTTTKEDRIVTEKSTPVSPINPKHYRSHPSGTECIEISEHMNFCLGNALKYIWRAGLKSEDQTEDLRKAKWYIEREIERVSEGM